MKQPTYNTALYLRLSREDENDGESNSIATQRMMLHRYAEENGLCVIDEYVDDGYSGSNFDRPDFQRMINDIEDGKINCVVTKDLSRLGRNHFETGYYMESYFLEHGIRYIAVDSKVDTNDPQSVEFAPFLNVIKNIGCLRRVFCCSTHFRQMLNSERSPARENIGANYPLLTSFVNER